MVSGQSILGVLLGVLGVGVLVVGVPVGWAAGGDEAFSEPQAAVIPRSATTNVAPIRPRVRNALTTGSFRLARSPMMVDRSLTASAKPSRRRVVPVTRADRAATEPDL
ncbi:hypothetical protein GCM10009745_08340 [Kribbella yunnanensis]|uniref:Uncharacterized protein n=1 Tax=Kribbella yunnanensis TaxID=190194 RepID=A0ABP4S6U2_9ACTN